MLEEISIQNFALIERAHVRFHDGFNVLTGETGAGKTILVGALGLLLGAKTDQDLIRSGAQEAILGGVVHIGDNPEVVEWLKTQGFSAEDDQLILKRVLRPNKRGACYINGAPASRAQLEELTAFLVDMHGQHEHQSLFLVDHHRKVLDRYLGLNSDLEVFSREFMAWNQLKKEYQVLNSQESDLAQEVEKLTFMIGEIESLHLKKGEDEELRQERHTLDHAEKMFSLLEQITQLMSSEKVGVLGSLKQVVHYSHQLSEIDPSLLALADRMESAFLEVEDLSDSLRDHRHKMDFSPERLEEINSRLAAIQGILKKYGPTEELLWENLEQAQEKLTILESGGVNKEQLLQNLQAQERKVLNLAGELSKKRKAGSFDLEQKIQGALAELGMKSARFKIQISGRLGDTGKPICTQHGMDQVEFMFSANPGESLKALREIASGGELSRVMLAIKSLLSESDNISILVFDEIDTGIGGEMGLALGRFMHNIGKSKQVLCITHLASLASFAGSHIKIVKKVEGDRTFTEVLPLVGEQRVLEVARMLSGDSSGQASIEHASQMLEKYAPGGF